MIAKEGSEFFDLLNLLGSEIRFFSDVVFEVEEFELSVEVPVDEFVVAKAD